MLWAVRPTFLLIWFFALWGCEERANPALPAPTPAPASSPPQGQAKQASQAAGSEAPPRAEQAGVDKVESESKVGESVAAPTRACVVRSRSLLGSAPSELTLVNHGPDLMLVASRPSHGGARLELSALRDGKAEPLHQVTLASALSARPTGLVRGDGSLSVAWVDVAGNLSLLELRQGKVSGARILIKGVDPRFSPALAEHSGNLLVAYAQTRDTAMHTMLTRVRGSELKSRDVTPISHGAGAPTFMLGAKVPVLIMLDARAGVSPLLEVGLDAAGEPLPAIVRTPISQPYAPPLLSVFDLGTEPQAVFTAIGRAAATAVGIVSLRRAEAPRALVPSLGYGELHFDLALGTGRAVFVSESPSAASLEAKRDLVLKVIDTEGEGPTRTLQAEQHSSSRPALAKESEAHAFSLVFLEGPELVWLRLACDA